MVSVRQVIVLAGLALNIGCATTGSSTSTPWSRLTQSVRKVAVPEAPPAPVAEFACAWQNRLQHLPDPSRGGSMIPGVVGQVFLYEADNTEADVNGDLVVVVSDATPRPDNAPRPKSEVWHFTQDTLRKMIVQDERFGKSIVLFLPWPDSWRDVNRLSVQARYDQPGVGNTLYAQPMTLTLDFTSPSGATKTPGLAGNFTPVPDPKTVMNGVRNGGTATQPVGFTEPVFAPPPPGPAPVGLFAPPPAMPAVNPTPPKEFKATISRK
jgi:hypothetical protein